jgi:hypothetical protein
MGHCVCFYAACNLNDTVRQLFSGLLFGFGEGYGVG